ncbi:MAG: hypothetical protein K0S44_2093 [Bacteroidetes bacterium]|jgi:hypothetical protein|nr:hypothetical protein [Bacteroidota bacterium]
MNINKHNYEAFFLDYHEGNLSPQQVADLLLFVEQHPELKHEFESFENFSLEDFSSYTFENKEKLKKEITLQNKDEYFCRSVDGTLTETETSLLAQFLKQHPQYLPDLELYRKTKLVSDEAIVFENKNELKQIAFQSSNNLLNDHREEMMISASEGLLTNEEYSFFKQQLSVDFEMQKNYSLFEKTKLQPEISVIFENKESLKRKEKKVIPFYFYVSVAATILLLFGMFVIFKNGDPDKTKLAEGSTVPSLKLDKPQTAKQNEAVIIQSKKLASNIIPIKKKTLNNSVPIDALNNNSEKETLNNGIAQNIPEPEIKKDIPQEEVIQPNNKPETNSTSLAKVDEGKKSGSVDFMSLGEIAASRIKEKTLDPEVYAMEKKNGSIKKFSGWDILQVVAKGVSKITGKKVEAKPTYNSEGEVTAYALGAGGFEISRGKKSN